MIVSSSSLFLCWNFPISGEHQQRPGVFFKVASITIHLPLRAVGFYIFGCRASSSNAGHLGNPETSHILIGMRSNVPFGSLDLSLSRDVGMHVVHAFDVGVESEHIGVAFFALFGYLRVGVMAI